MAALAGIIFDIDGTLVDSRLNFALIRSEMNLSPGEPILETLEQMPAAEAQRCQQILARHEEQGVRQAVPFPGVDEFLEDLRQRGIRIAAVTRNRQKLGQEMLARWSGLFEVTLGRENGPIKPDPGTILSICQQWGVEPRQVVFLGDYLFDMQAGRNAGTQTVLFSRGRPRGSLAGEEQADYVLDSFLDLDLFWQWLAKSL